MNFKKLTALLLAVVLCVGTLGVLTSCGGDGETIKIGVSGPFSGNASMYGIAVKNSAIMAIDEINEAGGLNGVKFKLIAVDDVNDATKIETNYESLIADGVQVSLGTVTTKPGIEFSALSKADNLFFLTPSATGDKIPEFSNGYQMCFADSNQGAVSADVFNNEFQGKKVGVFYQSDNDYSKGIFTQFMANIDDSFDVVEASFTESTSTEFTAQVNTLKDCDVIFMPIYYTPASTFMKQGIGIIKDDATYYGCDGLDGIDTIDGFDISTVPQKVSYLSHFNSMEAEGAAATYIANYKAKFGDKAPLNQFGAAAYDCVYAIYEAMKVAIESGKTIDANTSASDVCNALTEVFNGDFVFHGITGKPTSTGKSDITWDDGGYVNKTAVSYTVKEVTTK